MLQTPSTEATPWGRDPAPRPALGATLGWAAEDSLADARPLATAHPTELSHLTSLSRNLNQKLRQQIHRAVLPLDWGTLLSVQMLLEACSGATQGSARGKVPPTASITVQQSLPHAPPSTHARSFSLGFYLSSLSTQWVTYQRTLWLWLTWCFNKIKRVI